MSCWCCARRSCGFGPPFPEPPPNPAPHALPSETQPLPQRSVRFAGPPACCPLGAWPALCAPRPQRCRRVLFCSCLSPCVSASPRPRAGSLFFAVLTPPGHPKGCPRPSDRLSSYWWTEWPSEWICFLRFGFGFILSCFYRKEPQSQNWLKKNVILKGLPKNKQIMTIWLLLIEQTEIINVVS